MIIDLTRSRVTLAVDGRTVTVEGEAYLPGYGSPDFVAYKSSIHHWDPPFDCDAVGDEEKDTILATLKSDLQHRSMTLEVK